MEQQLFATFAVAFFVWTKQRASQPHTGPFKQDQIVSQLTIHLYLLKNPCEPAQISEGLCSEIIYTASGLLSVGQRVGN